MGSLLVTQVSRPIEFEYCTCKYNNILIHKTKESYANFEESSLLYINSAIVILAYINSSNIHISEIYT